MYCLILSAVFSPAKGFLMKVSLDFIHTMEALQHMGMRITILALPIFLVQLQVVYPTYFCTSCLVGLGQIYIMDINIVQGYMCIICVDFRHD